MITLFQVGAVAQQTTESFVLNDSNPYVYLKLDHVGPRKPLMKGEPATGVWMRIVNNCRVPILVPTVGSRTSSGEIEVLDEVVTVGRSTVKFAAETPEVSRPGEKEEVAPSQPPPSDEAPEGYADYPNDTPGLTEVLPGNSLLFSVPIDHVVGHDRYMRVRFSLEIPGSEHGPYSYADSFTVHVPPGFSQSK
jgi:hypothetical protein